jgi:prevent-host-death family protein
MSTMTTAAARDHFSDLVNMAAYAKERVTLTRHGKNVAAVIPIEDFLLLESLEDQADLADAKLALEEIKVTGTISLEELKAELKRK